MSNPQPSPNIVELQRADLLFILDAFEDGIAILDRQWRIWYLNRRAKELVGAMGDVIGLNHWEAFPATNYEGSPWLKHYGLAMNQGIASGFEEFHGQPLNVWLQAKAYPVPVGIAIFFRDVSDRRRSDAELSTVSDALRDTGEELRWTVELSAPIPWTADSSGMITSFSDQWLALTGLTHDEAMGEGWAQVPHPEDRPRMTIAWLHSLGTGEPYDIEHRVRTASGEFKWMRSRALPRRNAEGTITKWYGTTEDIEDRKRAEQALLRTEKLAAVGRLAASIAHEINNPLESVTNLLYLAKSSDSIADVKDYLNTAERELRRVSVITNQTLRFYKQTTSPREVTSEDLFESVLSVYQGKLVNSQIKVERRDRSNLPIECFDGEIRQVLSNLVGNAIDAMHPSGGRLFLRSREATAWSTGSRGLVLTVADTGMGMPAAVLRKIFEAFYTTKGITGNGLGLWVSKEIVDRHHGHLRVRSSQKEGSNGTVFSLFLPFKAVDR